MKRYFLIFLVAILSGFASLKAQSASYRTIFSCTTINGVKGDLKEDHTGRIKIDIKKKVILARVKAGFFIYDKDYDVRFIIDSVKKEKSADGIKTVYSCHYANDSKAFVTVIDSFNTNKNRREVSFLNDNNVQMFVVK